MVLTTYEVVNLEKNALCKIAWKYLIIDEAHRLKNEASQVRKLFLGRFYWKLCKDIAFCLLCFVVLANSSAFEHSVPSAFDRHSSAEQPSRAVGAA